MSNDRESESLAGDSLELNKETLQDLDVEGSDARDVKGGGIIVVGSQLCNAAVTTGKLSEGCQITPYKPGEITRTGAV